MHLCVWGGWGVGCMHTLTYTHTHAHTGDLACWAAQCLLCDLLPAHLLVWRLRPRGIRPARGQGCSHSELTPGCAN